MTLLHRTWTLSQEQLAAMHEAELRTLPIVDLRAEYEATATAIADIEQRVCHDNDALGLEAVRLFGGRLEYDEDVDLACWGLSLEARAERMKAEIERRRRLGRKLDSPRFSRQWIMDLKSRVCLWEYIAWMHDGTQLRSVGNHCEGLCPYHAENTASLHVWWDHYHCFGCHEHGDCIDWTLKRAQPTWVRAVEMVASYVGIILPDPEKQPALGGVVL